MQIPDSYNDKPFRTEIYRTDDALFLYAPPPSSELFWKGCRWIAILWTSYIGIFVLGEMSRRNFHELPALLIVGLIGGCLLLFVFWMVRLLECWHSLIRIDGATIDDFSWFRKSKHYQNTMERPERIELCYLNASLRFATKEGKPCRFHLKFTKQEIPWIREVIEQFENEVSCGVVMDSQEIVTPQQILDCMEYRGQQLRRVPDPTEQYSSADDTSMIPRTIQLRCCHCNAVVPRDHVLAEDALASCPKCGFLFEVPQIQYQTKERYSNIELRTQDDVLLLYQKPRFFNVWLLMLGILSLFDTIFYSVYLYIVSLSPGATLEDFGLAGPNAFLLPFVPLVLCVHAFFVFMYLWTIITHRYVEFRPESVLFRIRWLFFSYSWKVPRYQVGVPRISLLIQFWTGFLIPYGKNVFYIGTTSRETDRVEAEINHWLFTHDDDTSSDPKMISTLGGVEVDTREIRWHCRNCGRRLTAEELNFPHREARCSDCGQTRPLSETRHYAFEPQILKPKLERILEDIPQLSVHESITEKRIEYINPPVGAKIRIYALVNVALLLLFWGFVIAGLAYAFAPSFFMLDEEFAFKVVGLLLIIPLGPMLLVIGQLWLESWDDYRQNFTCWSTSFCGEEFILERKYKNRSEILRFEKSQIARFCREHSKAPSDELFWVRSLWFEFPSNLTGNSRNSNTLLLEDGSSVPMPNFQRTNNTKDDNAWLVNSWNEYLGARVV